MNKRISDIGERGLIRRLRDKFPSLHSIGDDCAILPRIQCPVVTTDSYFEGTHFHRWWAPPRIIGRRLLEAALSDIAAMGATAQWVFAALSIDPGIGVHWIEGFYQGLTEREDVVLAGGETVKGDRLGITLTIIGDGQERDTILRRSSLHPGDQLWISGLLGRALNAPSKLEKVGGLFGKDLHSRSGQLSGEELEQLRAFLQPRAELELGIKLRKMGVRCAIDISDGLFSEAAHLSTESSVDTVLEIDETLFFDSVKDTPLAASAAGEDYVLLFGAPGSLDFSSVGCSKIGRAETGNGEMTIFLNGERVSIDAEGYDHLGV
ncbi:MAG: thiamine-monophosphate kinase [Candidatus Aegiribacteria sp.]|nr:thiamine-monophosphate kinase [Candidatus Aegiribacteria sp.]